MILQRRTEFIAEAVWNHKRHSTNAFLRKRFNGDFLSAVFVCNSSYLHYRPVLCAFVNDIRATSFA